VLETKVGYFIHFYFDEHFLRGYYASAYIKNFVCACSRKCHNGCMSMDGRPVVAEGYKNGGGIWNTEGFDSIVLVDPCIRYSKGIRR